MGGEWRPRFAICRSLGAKTQLIGTQKQDLDRVLQYGPSLALSIIALLGTVLKLRNPSRSPTF
jgi:hypothetical protein